jgi:hypothetical protein
VNNIRGTLGRFALELVETDFAREMWAQFEQGELTADSELMGVCVRDERTLMPMLSWWPLRMPGRKRCNENWGGKARVPVAEATKSNRTHRRTPRHSRYAVSASSSYNRQSFSETCCAPNRQICFNSDLPFLQPNAHATAGSQLSHLRQEEVSVLGGHPMACVSSSRTSIPSWQVRCACIVRTQCTLGLDHPVHCHLLCPVDPD